METNTLPNDQTELYNQDRYPTLPTATPPKCWMMYLLHFDQRYPNGKRPRHYIGITNDINHRTKQHKRADKDCKRDARLMAVIREHGISFEVARVWETTDKYQAQKLERKTKQAGHYDRLCPLCKLDRDLADYRNQHQQGEH